MSSQPKNNIMTMAELLRAAKEKRAREEHDDSSSPEVVSDEQAAIPQDTIPQGTILKDGIVGVTILQDTIPDGTIPRRHRPARIIEEESEKKRTEVDVAKGYFKYLNDLSDRLIPELKLKPYEQVVLNRLYRLSRGWQSEECAIGLGALAKQCVMSRTSVQKSIGVLIEKGLIQDLGEDKKGGREGKRYRVLPTLSISEDTIVRRSIVHRSIVRGETSIPPDTTVVRRTIPRRTTIKDNNRNLKDTYTNTDEIVRVGGSKFSLEECRKYAESLKSAGIQNPGGYATTVFRTGEADELIDRFLRPSPSGPQIDASNCPDCHGTGYWYPEGVENGVARCRHEKVRFEEKT